MPAVFISKKVALVVTDQILRFKKVELQFPSISLLQSLCYGTEEWLHKCLIGAISDTGRQEQTGSFIHRLGKESQKH